MSDSTYIHKSHNVSVLVYHLVTSCKYRKFVFKAEELDSYLRTICLDIENRYEINFLEICIDKDHVHFFIQSIPKYSPTKIAQIVKSITAHKMFENFVYLKEELWGAEGKIKDEVQHLK
jgi:putative transposase